MTIALEDGGTATADLSALDNPGTDDQNLTGATLTGNSLQIDIEGGSSTTVDLSSLVGTDDQIANEVNITDAAGDFTATEVEGALAELAAGSTDDQQLDDPNTLFNAVRSRVDDSLGGWRNGNS